MFEFVVYLSEIEYKRKEGISVKADYFFVMHNGILVFAESVHNDEVKKKRLVSAITKWYAVDIK